MVNQRWFKDPLVFCQGNQGAKTKLLGSVIGTLLKNSVPPQKNKSFETKNDNLCEQKPVAFKKHTKEFKDAAFNSALKTWWSCWIQKPRNCTCFQQLLQCLHSTWVRLQTFIETWLRAWESDLSVSVELRFHDASWSILWPFYDEQMVNRFGMSQCRRCFFQGKSEIEFRAITWITSTIQI